jgi:hypothetical protein
MNAIMNLRVPYEAGNLLTRWETNSFSRRRPLRGVGSLLIKNRAPVSNHLIILNEVPVVKFLWKWIIDGTQGGKRCQPNCEQTMLKVTDWRRQCGPVPFIKSLLRVNWTGN